MAVELFASIIDFHQGFFPDILSLFSDKINSLKTKINNVVNFMFSWLQKLLIHWLQSSPRGLYIGTKCAEDVKFDS